METTAAAPSRCLLSNQKLLHLVRHAQGLHNLEAKKSSHPLTSIQFTDAELSSQGWQQVRDQRKNVSASGMLERIETSVGIFGSEEHPDHCGIKTSTLNRLPIIASELCRERMRKGRSRGAISQSRSRFPEVDFSLIVSEDDTLWEADELETNEAVAARGIKFIKWLLARKEKEIAVVSHGIFLQQTMIALKNKGYPLVDGDPFSRFENCEIRSVIIFNESVTGLGSDSWKTNYYWGRIPYYGLKLHEDSTKEDVAVDEVTNK